MELDDLKQTWQQSQIAKNSNTKIMDIIKHKSYGPLASLKRAFRKQMLLMIILPTYVIITNTNDLSHALNSILLWAYVAFFLGVIIFTYYNYRIVSKMERMDNLVRTNLEQQVDLLQTRMKWKRTGLMIALFFFFLLAEIVPYFQHYGMSEKWHSVAPSIRFLSYATFLILIFFVSTWANERKYGRHLKYLKELANEMQ